MNEPPYKRYIFSYYHNGHWWSIVIPAPDLDDARARLAKLSLARYDGELFLEIPLTPSWASALWAKLKGAFSRLLHKTTRKEELPIDAA